jgi:hypothetical protein
MKDNPTQKAREIAISKLDTEENEAQLFRTSRDTFHNLYLELREMPLQEIETLPDDLKAWVKDARDQTTDHQQADIMTLASDGMNLEVAKEHLSRLSEAANRLVKNVEPYWFYDWDITLAEAITENEESDSDIVQQLVFDSFDADCLFEHMQSEFPALSGISSWRDLAVKQIKKGILPALTECAAKKRFPGRCRVCKDF